MLSRNKHLKNVMIENRLIFLENYFFVIEDACMHTSRHSNNVLRWYLQKKCMLTSRHSNNVRPWYLQKKCMLTSRHSNSHGICRRNVWDKH